MSPISAPPRIFDSARRTARLVRSARRFGEADFLHMRAADNAVASLEVILRDFAEVVDLSAQPEPFAALLKASIAAGRVGPVQVVGDTASRAAPGAGPLAALANIWMGSPAEVLLVLAIDLPFVPTDRLRTMAGLARQEGRSVMPHRNGRFEPLAAAWHRSCLPTMQHTLAAGQRSFQPLCADLLAAGRLRPLASDDPGAQWLANLNRPEDLLPSAPAGRSFPGNR